MQAYCDFSGEFVKNSVLCLEQNGCKDLRQVFLVNGPVSSSLYDLKWTGSSSECAAKDNSAV